MAASKLINRAAVTVSSVEILVVAACPTRKKLVIQQTSANPVRVGASGVTASTGISLAQRSTLIFEGPDCPTDAIYAIREGGVDGTVTALEFAEV